MLSCIVPPFFLKKILCIKDNQKVSYMTSGISFIGLDLDL